MKTINKYIVFIVIVLWALVWFFFFNKYYPYHLVHREQIQLFLYSSDYIRSYFQHPAWLACLTGDFLTQFFYFVAGGGSTIALLLLIMGVLFYWGVGRLSYFHNSEQNSKWSKLLKIILTVALMAWEALRNCGIDYELSSTLSIIGGILIFIVYDSIPKPWQLISGLVILPLSYWLFGYGIFGFLILATFQNIRLRRFLPAFILFTVALIIPALLRHTYLLTSKQAYQLPGRTFFDKPNLEREKLLKMDVEASYGHWNYVAKITEKEDLKSRIASYYYNLSHVRQGSISADLMNTYQPGSLGLFIPLNSYTAPLSIWCSNEVWFQLGDMTMAEHATLLAMIFSPKHRSSRMVKRLAEINLINGDTLAAMKYLHLLENTWLYKQWALKRMPCKEDKDFKSWLEQKRKSIPTNDTIRATNSEIVSIRNLLQYQPDNRIALDYLLCYDLLSKDIKSFMQDYTNYKVWEKGISGRIYGEAIIIGLTNHHASSEEANMYKVPMEVYKDFRDYTDLFAESRGNITLLQPKYGKSYWFYFHFANFVKK
jgi:hypothetical protein